MSPALMAGAAVTPHVRGLGQSEAPTREWLTRLAGERFPTVTAGHTEATRLPSSVTDSVRDENGETFIVRDGRTAGDDHSAGPSTGGGCPLGRGKVQTP